MFLLSLALASSLFLCSFSSVIIAMLLVFSTLSVILTMYWNLMNMIPLYLFSLFMLGGLYVLIGFVIMGDMNDLDMISSGLKMKEFLMVFTYIFCVAKLNNLMKSDMDLSNWSFSPLKTNDWLSWGPNSSTFIFLIFMLLIYLFIIHSVVKSSTSGGGFMK